MHGGKRRMIAVAGATSIAVGLVGALVIANVRWLRLRTGRWSNTPTVQQSRDGRGAAAQLAPVAGPPRLL